MGDMREFQGVIGRLRADSEAWWPPQRRPPAGAPNVMIVILDDVGFAQLGCFGSNIATPTFDALARGGRRYSNFHTTSLCSPTRACVMTGRNHHSAGMGRITDLATGFPGYDARIPRSVGFLPEMLVPHGYAAYALGKWHLTPDEESHLGSPRASWPLGRGFERFYGFMQGETNQFSPSLVHDNHRVLPPRSFDDGYHLTEDLADHAIEFIADLRHIEPTQPFLLYFASGACHSPHQAPADWIAKYQGQFDGGWDAWRDATVARQRAMGVLPNDVELSPRPEWVPSWDSLSPDERRLYARYMECFAGYLSHTDAQVGRVVDFLRRTGDLDNTVVIIMSDNGASSEGGPTGSINDARPWNRADRPFDEALAKIDDIGGPWIHNNYPWGWTVAGNTPFRRWKREVHEGGVCDPFIIHWPRGIDAEPGVDGSGGVRRQYAHAIDITPTILDIVGIEAPTHIGGVPQKAIEGKSFRSTFTGPEVPATRTRQYFEMFGCRALYDSGWKAVTYIAMGGAADDDAAWELYHVEVDPSECHDLAAQQPERLARMIEQWWHEAETHQVFPVDSMPFFEAMQRPSFTMPRGRYVYWPGTGPVEEGASVNVRDRSHRITATLDVPADGPIDGVLISQGSGYGGYVLFVQDGVLTYAHNFVGMLEERTTATTALTPGQHVVEMCYERTEPRQGAVTLLVDGIAVGAGAVTRFTPVRWSICGDGLTIGYSAALPVVRDYRSPFRFTGAIEQVVVEVEGEPVIDPVAEAELSMRAQ
jgi:arylsulfatase A-like enzyme